MKKEYIHIEEANVYGLRNSKYVVRGCLTDLTYKIVIKVDGKKVKYEEIMPISDFAFYLEVPISKKDKRIDFYLVKGRKEELICTRNNSFMHRLKSKIRNMIAPITQKVRSLISPIVNLFKVIGRGIRFLWKEHHFLVPPTLWGKYIKEFKEKVKETFGIQKREFLNPSIASDYALWLKEHPEEEEEIKKFKYNPKISILIPVYNVNRKLLSECLDSVLAQKYENYEVCLVDDCSTMEDVKKTLEEYKKKDKRIKVKYRKQNGHISRATNDALDMADGEFVGLMDDDDLLTDDALYQVVKVLNEDKSLDMIYSDEDKLGMDGTFESPHFKSDFAPDTLLGSNYICHFCVLRKSIVKKIGGFRVGYEGSQDHDLVLRFTEVTNSVYHIPKILYHWRMIPGSTAVKIDSKSYAIDAGVRSVEDALKRRGIKGKVSVSHIHYVIEYLYDKEPSISIIIPTRDHADDTRKCLESIFTKTKYKNYEVVLVDNDSTQEALFDLIKEYKKKYSNFRVVEAKMPFNYSKINNIAVKTCKSDYIVLLNNDTVLITEDWLKIMVGYAMQDHIGTVGVKLLYPDDTIQHAGVVLGVGGIANHAFLNANRYDLGIYGRIALPHNYSANTGACLMVSRKKYDEVLGLEEDLMVAYNDIDFNLKLLEKGYYNIYIPQVELYHYESKSRGLDNTTEKYKKFLEEQDYMEKKWGKLISNDPFYNINLSRKRSFMLDRKKRR